MLALLGAGGARLATLLLQVDTDGLTSDQKTQIALEALKHGDKPDWLVPVLVPCAFFAVVVLVFWLILRQKQVWLRSRDEFNKQLLDKFSSGHELGEFLGSKEGQQFLASMSAQRRDPKDRALAGVRTGVVLTVLGLGFLGLAIVRHPFAIPGVVVLCIGFGLLLSAVISRRLSTKWEAEQKAGGPGGVVSQ